MSAGSKSALYQSGFANRHRFSLLLLWAHVPVLATVGLLLDHPVHQIAFTSSTFIVFALGGMTIRSRRPAAIAVALGLLTTSGIISQYAGGGELSFFHFLLMICVISFYRDLATLAIATVSAATYHFITLGIGSSISLAAAHTAVLGALSLLLVVGWRFTTDPEPPLDRSGTRFRMSFEEAPIGMAVLKPSGEFVEVNRAMGRILDVDAVSLIGANITGLIHADDQTDLGEVWQEIGNGDAHAASVWMRWLTGDSRSVWGRVSLSLLPRTPDAPAMVILQLEDATSQHVEKQRLEMLLRGKDEFVAAVGDELRQPLGLLIDLTDDGSDPTETLPRIGSHAREIASVLDDLVASARSDITPVSVTGQPLNVKELCQEVLATFSDRDNIATEFHAVGMWADPILTRQILNGLIGNALRYGGPSLVLRTMSSGPDTVVQIIDDGPAIPEGERSRLFRGDLSSGEPLTRPAVVGLSLTVSRRFARQMDGDIVYRRTADGQNVFELRVPSEQIRELPRRRGVIEPGIAV